MNYSVDIGFFDVWIILGVFLGLIVAFFFLKKGIGESYLNTLEGFLILTMTLAIFEEFLNNTGLIVKVLPISNFSEPLNFTFAPLFYLIVRTRIYQIKNRKKNWLHFIPAIFWSVYLMFYFIQSDALKYNSYIYSKHPDWPTLEVDPAISSDPLGIGQYVNELTALHFSVYALFIIFLFRKELMRRQLDLYGKKEPGINSALNSSIHFAVLITIFAGTKLYFGNDIGDYFIASYVSFMIFATTVKIFNSSSYFEKSQSFTEFPAFKYKKSSLGSAKKTEIARKIKVEMEENNYFRRSLASLPELSKRINESQHHVSQVINEKMGKNFFELLAWYRVEDAKKWLKTDSHQKFTIEEIAEKVGYNSKSSFNKAFKEITGQTPSKFRNS
jgi:AraC-like DNA-binding protein